MSQAVTARNRRSPIAENGTVRIPPPRRPNATVRTREHLTEAEVGKLAKAAKGDGRRHGHRDAAMIVMAFRHGLRVTELVDLRWSDVDFKAARLHVRRLKGSISGTHPVEGDELRGLRTLLKRQGDTPSEFMFTTERGGPMSPAGFRRMLARLAEDAGLGALKVHPHMLRHATGYKLANDSRDTRLIQDYLGHKQISNTVRYTALNAGRFKGLFSK